MAKVYQAVTTKATNKNAKFKVKYTYKVYTNPNSNKIMYSYSKIISKITTKKYSYAV